MGKQESQKKYDAHRMYRDKDKRRAYVRAWKKTDKGKAANRRALIRSYGITPEAYDAMLISQDGACAICRTVVDRPHIDHNHASGVVRGLLCIQCNVGLGQFRDDATLLTAAISYVKGY